MIFAVWIINKAGGLVYQKDFTEGLEKLTSNDYLVLAGTLHGVHAISSRISPVSGSSGLESLETNSFTLTCYQSPTGLKFVIFTDPQHSSIDAVLRKIYEIYSDFALKNPFYTPEMPIRCELFEIHLFKLIKTINAGS
ncbi:hypothetical protein HMI54_008534 [Coelomomyces lativittatus]|nr:hypothetical protein HMI54_008534 [Coelomomyces lativittatus]KAJ1511106.1 hypothetical protein HMI56_005806 [Coelomomyces lativittatus]KAJ1516697.1 hypothetical protein HMI55_001632 [Coelomomyces lativittatus]